MGIRIAQTFNEDLILSVLTDKAIWPTISEDGQQADKFVIDVEMPDFYYLAVIDDGVVIGIYVLHPFNGCTLEIHANILPVYRKEYAHESAQAVLKWIDKNIPDNFQKLIARIPVIYPNVYRFTMNHGFDDEGLLTKSCFKNGELHDLHLLGLQRSILKDGKQWDSEQS